MFYRKEFYFVRLFWNAILHISAKYGANISNHCLDIKFYRVDHPGFLKMQMVQSDEMHKMHIVHNLIPMS